MTGVLAGRRCRLVAEAHQGLPVVADQVVAVASVAAVGVVGSGFVVVAVVAHHRPGDADEGVSDVPVAPVMVIPLTAAARQGAAPGGVAGQRRSPPGHSRD